MMRVKTKPSKINQKGGALSRNSQYTKQVKRDEHIFLHCSKNAGNLINTR